MTTADRGTVEKMLAGDKAAFELLYRQFHLELYRMAYLISGNKADSEDILQETFVEAWLHRGELKNPAGFEGWLMKTLVRKAWRVAKRSKRDVFLDEFLEEDGENIRNERLLYDRASISPLENAIAGEVQRAVGRAVAELPLKLRTVIALYYYKDYSVKEIAKLTGSFEGTVKSRLYKARAYLKERLSGMEGDL